ncbi:hypothetical protein BZB76_1514 [Actinomadura pelletieri DSM 43383]|uniref:Uncharacterized protein n=1 Tax=Actinomadura pelletieri DSM 43383 TaxID=1120940 RepID=A0A495QRQ0_9ACTN|nr:hypothetical protein [Actinomadura pelletieri]RKS76164.1 hypothetical protein BZB76_1514 [Actinomadura pelletieri DSM 43383]
MTERGPFTGMRGAPGPAEPSNTGDPPAPAGGSRTAPADLSEVRRTDAIIDSLAARRAAGSTARSATFPEGTDSGRPRHTDDPAVRLLTALITDVDDQDPAPEASPPPPGPGSGPRRRGPRTIVALGVAGAVLASTGVAAAGGGTVDRPAAFPAPTSPADQQTNAKKPPPTDTDAGFHAEAPRPRLRPVADTDRPAASRKPSGPRKDRHQTRTRPRYLFPPAPPAHGRPQNPPGTPTYSAPPVGYGTAEAPRRPQGGDKYPRNPSSGIQSHPKERTHPYLDHCHHCRND